MLGKDVSYSRTGELQDTSPAAFIRSYFKKIDIPIGLLNRSGTERTMPVDDSLWTYINADLVEHHRATGEVFWGDGTGPSSIWRNLTFRHPVTLVGD